MTSSQQASWETNTYVVTTTRILVVFGLTYLVKSSYQLFRMLRATANGTVTSERMIGAEETNIGFEIALNGFSSGDPAPFDLKIVPDMGELVEISRPLPVYYRSGLTPQ